MNSFLSRFGFARTLVLASALGVAATGAVAQLGGGGEMGWGNKTCLGCNGILHDGTVVTNPVHECYGTASDPAVCECILTYDSQGRLIKIENGCGRQSGWL